MAYQPRFTITAHLVAFLEAIATLREKILAATIQVPWIPLLQKNARIRNTHSSTAIEGNPLTLEQVRMLPEVLAWWNKESSKWSPVITSAVVHYRFEEIHPFSDGNGRTGRTLALWELYRKGFDTHHIFSVDEIYWENRPRYYQALDAVHKHGGELTGWLEYTTEALHLTLERVWGRVQHLAAEAGPKKIVLRPKQEQLLRLLKDRN